MIKEWPITVLRVDNLMIPSLPSKRPRVYLVGRRASSFNTVLRNIPTSVLQMLKSIKPVTLADILDATVPPTPFSQLTDCQRANYRSYTRKLLFIYTHNMLTKIQTKKGSCSPCCLTPFLEGKWPSSLWIGLKRKPILRYAESM